MPDDTLDDAALLQRLDTAIADSARLHAELRQLRMLLLRASQPSWPRPTVLTQLMTSRRRT